MYAGVENFLCWSWLESERMTAAWRKTKSTSSVLTSESERALIRSSQSGYYVTGRQAHLLVTDRLVVLRLATIYALESITRSTCNYYLLLTTA